MRDRMSASVYLLWCGPRRSLYCGWTTDVERRLAAHRAGTGAKYTRAHQGDVALAAVLPMPDAATARREEARIKRLSRAKKLAIVAGAQPSSSVSSPRTSPERPGAARAASSVPAT
jgi:putative endonuclease